jgi:hypothetical protein
MGSPFLKKFPYFDVFFYFVAFRIKWNSSCQICNLTTTITIVPTSLLINQKEKKLHKFVPWTCLGQCYHASTITLNCLMKKVSSMLMYNPYSFLNHFSISSFELVYQT